MTSEPVAELHPDYSSANTTATPWPEVVAVLEHAEIFWISTVRADGRPHVAPLPAMWLDNALHFSTGLDEQKGRNLLRNQNCILTTGNNSYRQGLDVVVEDARNVSPIVRRWNAWLSCGSRRSAGPGTSSRVGSVLGPRAPSRRTLTPRRWSRYSPCGRSRSCRSDAASALRRPATDSEPALRADRQNSI